MTPEEYQQVLGYKNRSSRQMDADDWRFMRGSAVTNSDFSIYKTLTLMQ
jgi:hypothetical protein